MPPTNGEPAYKLSLLAAVLPKLTALRDRAAERGVGLLFAADLKAVERRLAHDPLGWGDPLRDYKHLAMTRQRGKSDFLLVYYAVHRASRVVFVQDVQPNPHGPLADPPA